MAQPVIEKVDPGAGVEGGEIIITCTGFEPPSWRGVQISFDAVTSRLESASSERVVAPVPAGVSGKVGLRIVQGEESSEAVDFYVAEKIADGVHPVANPAFDPDNGTIYTTLSGTRGQKVPISVYKITPEGNMQAFL